MDWNLTANLFETTTRRRFPAMHSLLEDHYWKCKGAAERNPADEDFAVMLTRVTAAHAAWNSTSGSRMVCLGQYKSKTYTMRKVIADLRGKHIAKWDAMVSSTDALQESWLPGTPGHLQFFPNGRKPFQQGPVESRIRSVDALAKGLTGVPVMATVAGLVTAFHSVIRTARTEQQAAGAAFSSRSHELETQRKAAAIVLQKNMARLMEKYAERPEKILTFFDLKNVRAKRRKKEK